MFNVQTEADHLISESTCLTYQLCGIGSLLTFSELRPIIVPNSQGFVRINS